jgi:hypothetical protein
VLSGKLYNDANTAWRISGFDKETGTKRYKRITRGRFSWSRRHVQKWTMDSEEVIIKEVSPKHGK